MPRWARMLSCTFTGSLLALGGFLLAAYTHEQPPRFWASLQASVTTPEFWSLVLLFGLLTVAGLALGRAMVHLWGVASSPAGFVAGGAVSLLYVVFLLSSHLEEWGGWPAAWPRIWPAAGLVALPFALAGAVANWLWERFE